MEKNSTAMTFLKAIMTIFIITLSIHFFGFLFITNQISDVNKLEENVSSVKVSLQTTISDCGINLLRPELTSSEEEANKKKQPVPHPQFVDNDPVQVPENVEPVSRTRPLKKKNIPIKINDPKGSIPENVFSDIRVLDYWAPFSFPLVSNQVKKTTVENTQNKEEIKKDSFHLNLFSNILQTALDRKQGKLLEENEDSTSVYLLIPIKDVPFSSVEPPERQLGPYAEINGNKSSIVAVFRTNENSKYILIISKSNFLLPEKEILQLNIGNPDPILFQLNFNKTDIKNGTCLIRRISKNN